MAKVTLQTIADRVGVSRMTVSNAFSRPDQLSAELRGRIMAAAEELGYAGPDPAARVLARGATGAVGVLLTDSLRYAFADEFTAQFLGAVAEELAPTGLSLTLLMSSGPTESEPARNVPMDGALIYSCDEGSAALEWLERRRLPLVFVDHSPTPGFSSVNIDDRGGARLAAQHLVDLGHRAIAIVTKSVGSPVGVVADPAALRGNDTNGQRMHGWLDALTAADIEPVVVQQSHSAVEPGRAAAALLLGLPDRPTAVLCMSDAMAYGVVQAALDAGLSVPDDLSVIGFDDAPFAERMSPPLTTVRQDAAAKGRLAVRQLVAAIERRRHGADAHVERALLPVELIVRGSTSKLRGA